MPELGIGTGGHDGMVSAINSMTANGHGPWNYTGEDYYNIDRMPVIIPERD